MRKENLTVGMMVVTGNGKARLVMPTKTDGLVLVSENNKMLKVDKLNNDLTRGRYKVGNDVVQVYDVMDGVNSQLFTIEGRDLLFDRSTGFDTTVTATSASYDSEDNYENDYDYFDYDDDEEEDCTCDTCTCSAPSTFTKADLAPGMLAVTRDGKNRLAIPTSDKGLVLATPNSTFIRTDKLNDDLTIAGYNKTGKNVDKVYGIASGVTTDFYSTEGRQLLFDRR